MADEHPIFEGGPGEDPQEDVDDVKFYRYAAEKKAAGDGDCVPRRDGGRAIG
ncbi:Uu.00g134630.m01.CDS01 [Anthostomella pinea]|uniref:Uu.00g134630.m01.CDS01 n=1 Tax=Anthostomella pinea TaxID=933095 RepID=A0AAI8VNZ3_9PEZI|nr:Uu.00g134630.m01.CDS01 [Anthostomella pinea]